MGIAVRTGVPVETGPLAGIDPQEIADPRPLAERIRAAVEEAGLAPRLGPKVSVVVDGGGQLTMDAVTADVRLKAVHIAAGIQWRVSVAGDGQGARPLVLADEGSAHDIAIAALRMVGEKGRDSHARDLSERQLRSLSGWHSVTPPLSCRTSPPQGGDCAVVNDFANHQRRTNRQGSKGRAGRGTADLPLAGRCPAGQRGVQERRPVGTFDLTEAAIALCIALPMAACQPTKLSPSPKAPSPSAPPKSASPQAAPSSSSVNRQPPTSPPTHRRHPRLRHLSHRPAHPHRGSAPARRPAPPAASPPWAIAEAIAAVKRRRHSTFTLHHVRLRQGLRSPRPGGTHNRRRRKWSRTCRERDGKGPSCRLQAGL